MNLIIEILIIVAVAIPIQAVIIMVQTSVTVATVMGEVGGKIAAAVLMAVTNTTVI